MKKFYYLTIILISLGLILSISLQASENDLEVVNNEVEGTIIYPSQWDIEVLDFSLKPAGDDILNALTIRNLGLASYTYLEEVILYEDDGDGIFEGWQKDIEIGSSIYYDPNQVWYWQNLNVNIPQEGKRFFVAIETKKNANILTDRRTIQMGISPQYDEAGDGVFDFSKDKGIFMASGNNGPAAGITNSKSHTLHKATFDSLAPQSVITYPAEGKEITEESLIIIGCAKDQGGSTPSWVKINITKEGEENDIWQDVIPTSSNYADWQFNWTDFTDGVYSIKTKSADWIGNTKTEDGITIAVQTIPPGQDEPEEPAGGEEADGEEEAEGIPVSINDGDLVRAQKDYKVYIIKGNYRRWIQSAEIFTFYGHLSFRAVKEVSKSEIESYTESWLVRADGDTKVYEINSDGTKHWLNMTVQEFSLPGRNWDMVYVVNSQEKDFYITGADVLK